jgi:hypothetical protein
MKRVYGKDNINFQVLAFDHHERQMDAFYAMCIVGVMNKGYINA